MANAASLDPHIAYCGLDCSGCDVYRATKFDDDRLRESHAQKVFDQFKVVVEPQSVNCHGCRDSRPKSGYCSWCEVRKCAIDRDLENCAYCADFPCAKLEKVHAAMISVGKAIDGIASARLNLDAIRRTQGLEPKRRT